MIVGYAKLRKSEFRSERKTVISNKFAVGNSLGGGLR